MPFMNFIPEEVRTAFVTGWESLKNLQFTFLNPVFWLAIFIIFLLLLRPWGAKKSFSFAFIVAIVLLFTTEAERFAGAAFVQAGEPFDPFFIRVIAALVIGALSFLYFFMMR